MRYHQYMGIYYAFSSLILGYLIYKHMIAQKNKPTITKAQIVYQEWFASGFSEANLMTRLGGARNCLRLIVTAEYLTVTSWFLFVPFSAYYDLEHVIPLEALQPIEQIRIVGIAYLRLAYQDPQGQVHSICLLPKNQEDFCQAIEHTC